MRACGVGRTAQGLVDDFDSSNHELPASFRDGRTGARCADLQAHIFQTLHRTHDKAYIVVVRQVNVEDELALDRLELARLDGVVLLGLHSNLRSSIGMLHTREDAPEH